MTDEQAQAKLELLAGTIERLRALPRGSLAELRADDRNLDAALHRLQVAIQILIDVGSYVVARLGLGVPQRSLDIREALERAGKLPAGSAARFGKVFSFRNRVVHLYDRVDDEVVFEILTHHLGDLEDLPTRYIDALPR